MNINLVDAAGAPLSQQEQTELSISSMSKTAKGGLSVNGEAEAGSSGGDSVSISDQGRALSMQAKNAGETQEAEAGGESTYQKILKKIRELQQQIREAEADPTLSEEQRRQKVQLLQSQLLALQSQLTKSGGGGGGAGLPERAGGTPAEGFASSLT